MNWRNIFKTKSPIDHREKIEEKKDKNNSEFPPNWFDRITKGHRIYLEGLI